MTIQHRLHARTIRFALIRQMYVLLMIKIRTYRLLTF